MDQHVADVEFTDGVWRAVYQDSRGRQYVIDARQARNPRFPPGFSLTPGRRAVTMLAGPRSHPGKTRLRAEDRAVSITSIACLTCRERVAFTRGCCLTCYSRHAKHVRGGKTTWAELERRGRVLPGKLGWRATSCWLPLATESRSGPAAGQP
jgi:hypothetical protein